MSKHLVLVGGGHAHLTLFPRLNEYVLRGCRVTVISPSSLQYYSGMSPGLLSRLYRPQDARFHIKKTVEAAGAAFIEDAVVSIEPGRRILVTKSGAEVAYDAVSFNIGSSVPVTELCDPHENVFTVKPLSRLLAARDRVVTTACDKTLDIVVIGGGPTGLEVAGNVWLLVHTLGGRARISIVPGERLLLGHPDRAYRCARASLTERGINVLDGVQADRVDDALIGLSSGKTLAYDVCFIAWGLKPHPLFKDSGIPTGEQGGMLVNRYLQSTAHPELFGGGDCIDYADGPLDKVGVYAVRENPILFENLIAFAENRPLRVFRPQRKYMLIFNLGDGTGLLVRGKFVWRGRLAMILKTSIDTRFVRRFQVSGERIEPD